MDRTESSPATLMDAGGIARRSSPIRADSKRLDGCLVVKLSEAKNIIDTNEMWYEKEM